MCGQSLLTYIVHYSLQLATVSPRFPVHRLLFGVYCLFDEYSLSENFIADYQIVVLGMDQSAENMHESE